MRKIDSLEKDIEKKDVEIEYQKDYVEYTS